MCICYDFWILCIPSSWVDYVAKEIKKAIGDNILKVIIETSEWNLKEIKDLTQLVIDSRANYIKTSTGTSSSGAKLEEVKLMKDTITKNNSSLKIKASGGIKTKEQAIAFIQSGAERLGTSGGVEIVQDKISHKDY